MSLLDHRDGSIEVVYVARVPQGGSLRDEALAEVAHGFDDQAKVVAGEVQGRLFHQDNPWHFQRRDGQVAAELMVVAADLDHQHLPSVDVVVVVGDPSGGHHHVGGSVEENVVRAGRFPVIVVP
jgi:nucleotide-binding universal stress UspA family protein